MTQILLRIFIKNHDDTGNPAVHASIGKLAGGAGIVCNSMLFLAKVLIGIFTGSLSILADGINNLSDASSSVVTLVGFQMAQRPADKKHPYGHARYEYLSGFVVATLIIVIGVNLLKSSIDRIIHPRDILFSGISLAVMLLSVALKLWMCFFFRTLGRRINSTTLLATSADSRNDVIATLAVFAGALVNIYFQINLDGWIGLAVSLFILWSGIGIAKDTISPLLGHGADTELIEKLEQMILSHERILGIHDLMVHDYGPGRYYASVHVELSAEENPREAHERIDHIEYDALKELGVHLVIHHDPIPVNDAEYNEMRGIVSDIVAQINPEFSMHDFRILHTHSCSRLIFDLDVPYSQTGRQKELEAQIIRKLQEAGRDYKLSIHLDGKE